MKTDRTTYLLGLTPAHSDNHTSCTLFINCNLIDCVFTNFHGVSEKHNKAIFV